MKIHYKCGSWIVCGYHWRRRILVLLHSTQPQKASLVTTFSFSNLVTTCRTFTCLLRSRPTSSDYNIKLCKPTGNYEQPIFSRPSYCFTSHISQVSSKNHRYGIDYFIRITMALVHSSPHLQVSVKRWWLISRHSSTIFRFQSHRQSTWISIIVCCLVHRCAAQGKIKARCMRPELWVSTEEKRPILPNKNERKVSVDLQSLYSCI